VQKRMVIGSGAALALLISATNARAEEPFTLNKPQVGGGLNYGIFMGDDGGGLPNVYGFGLGLDGGYTLGSGISGLYIGGELNYFFGGSKTAGSFETSVKVLHVGVEAGYDIGLSPDLIVRPKAGVGYASASIDVSGNFFGDQYNESQSAGGLLIPIGAGLVYSMGKWFIAGDLRYAILSITQEEADLSSGTTADVSRNASGLWLGAGAGAAF